MTQPDSTAPKVCAVCGVVLSRLGPGSLPHEDDEWVHVQELVGEKDHVAIPVDYGDVPINSICDFCFQVVPAGHIWVVPAETFVVPRGGGTSLGHWAGCDTCATLVRRRRWTQLINRAAEGFLARNTPTTRMSKTEAKSWLRELYGQLELNMTGPPRPWVAGDEKHR